jgi:mercuric ion binding protein
MNMIKFLKIFFVPVIFILFSTTALAQKEKAVQTLIVKTAIYCDHCKACETCGPKFEKVLLKEKGVQMVTLNEAEMTVKVVYNSKKTNPGAIRRAISKLGYDADDIKADAGAYEGLDGCCKK